MGEICRSRTNAGDNEPIQPGDTVIEIIDGGAGKIYRTRYTMEIRGAHYARRYRQPEIPESLSSAWDLPGDNRREPKPAKYVGQAEKDLRKRFRSYRSRGRNPLDPPGTTTLLAQRYLAELSSGVTVSLEIIDDPEIGLTNREVRNNLERKYIAEIDETKFEVLNRALRSGSGVFQTYPCVARPMSSRQKSHC